MPTPRLLRRLSAIEVTVPSPADTADYFSTALDLGALEPDGDARHLTVDDDYGSNAPQRLLTLRPGEELGVAGVAFDVSSETELATVRERLERLGIGFESVDDDICGGAGLRFLQPDGVPVECRILRRGSREKLPPSDVRPRRLGHVNLKMPEPGKAAEFFTDVLSFRLSEQLGDMLYFLRINSDHHNLAFRPATEPNVHHIAFEVPGWDNFRVICDHMFARGMQIEFGPGRHAPGNQLFMYLTEPSSGLRIEVFADMAKIDDEETYTPIRRDIDRMRSLNMWGPMPPQSFLD